MILGLTGIVTVPLDPNGNVFTEDEVKRWEADLLKTIQQSVGIRGVLFEGEVELLTNHAVNVTSVGINELVEETDAANQVNTEAVNDTNQVSLPKPKPMQKASTKQLKPTKRGLKKGFKYPRKGANMHWKTREKLERERKLK